MECQPADGQSLGSLSGPCFVDRHDECQSWLAELSNVFGVRGCSCQRHVDSGSAVAQYDIDDLGTAHSEDRASDWGRSVPGLVGSGLRSGGPVAVAPAHQ